MAGSRLPGHWNEAAKAAHEREAMARAHAGKAPGPIGEGRVLDPHAMIAQERELGLDIAQFILDLAGVVEPTPFADGFNALISVARGDWLGASISGLSMIPYIGDAAKVGELPKYLRSIQRAIELARRDEHFAKLLEPALKRLRSLLEDLPTGSLPEKAREAVQGIRSEIDRFLGGRWVRRLDFAQVVHEARLNGSSAGQFAIRRGEKVVTANVKEVVSLLEETAAPSRHIGARRDAKSLLEMMAEHKWKVTAGPHPSASDATHHITIEIEGVKQQFHLRLDAQGHLFQISHPRGTGLNGIKPWASPGS
jgi:hypothetical protein